MGNDASLVLAHNSYNSKTASYAAAAADYRGFDTQCNSVILLRWPISPLGKNRYVYHECISVFGKFYEYTPTGVNITARKKRKYTATHLGTTEIPQEIFENWIFENNERFLDTNFDIGNNNSCHFAVWCCEILKVQQSSETLEIPQNEMSAKFLSTEDYLRQLNAFSSYNMFRS